MRNIAIILGGGVNGLGMLRNLGANGVEVYCVAEKPDASFYSKFCKKNYLVKGCQTNKEILKTFLNNFEVRYDKAVIFATSDMFAYTLSCIKNDLTNGLVPLVADKCAMDVLVKKSNFYKSLSAYSIPYPKTYYPSSIVNIKTLSNAISYPVLVKPSESQPFQKRFSKKGFVANNPADLLKYYELCSKYKLAVVFQEIIPGAHDKVYSIAGFFNRENNVQSLFVCHRLRGWPIDFGISSAIESIPLSHLGLVKDSLVDYLKTIGYYGIMEAEFKFDDRDKLFKLIEINARSWWQNSLPTKCGLNIVHQAYLDAIGKKVNYVDHYTNGVFWVNSLLDFASVMKSNKPVSDWIKTQFKASDWSYFHPHDTLPWLASIQELPIVSIKQILSR